MIIRFEKKRKNFYTKKLNLIIKVKFLKNVNCINAF